MSAADGYGCSKTGISTLACREWVEYQLLLSEMAVDFVKALKGNIDSMRTGFERLGRYLGVDRIGLVLFSADGLIAKETVYWNSEKWIYDQSAEFYSLMEFPWLMRQLKNGQPVVLSNLSEMPRSVFSERDYFENYGIRSFAARPLVNREGGKVAGFWHFDATAEKRDLDPGRLEMLSVLEEALLTTLQVRSSLRKSKSVIQAKDILLNNTDIQMWYMLNPTVYGSVNEAHARFFGKSSEEMTKAEIYSVLDVNVANLFSEITLEVFENKLQVRRELSLRDCRNAERVLLVSWNPIFDGKQEVAHVICSAQDITDLKKTQEVIAANQKLTVLNERFKVMNEELVLTNDKLSVANRELQKEIAERKLAEERLGKAYGELKNAQLQIIQQEKMASIGQLAAGVAHEINNPMGFIISNLSSLQGYTVKMSAFLAAQDEVAADLSGLCGAENKEKASALLEKLQEAKRVNKIGFIMDDIKELMEETLEGADRVKNIVQDLKGFARVANDDGIMTDINAGLKSTINIIWNELKYKTTVTKEFGELPLVYGNPGQLNQVFMNLLLNAVQAIETQGDIRIRTRADENNVFVTIADTGCGMEPEVMSRIFEPFFTTKEVGKGTGLGLSVSYEIIKKHGGEISVESIVGKGTTFTVRIPVVERE
jgi:PAS domain S-box-containing protein